MTGATVLERQPHAILDRDSRWLKARKIAELLESKRTLRDARLLDVGAGSGFIAHFLADAVGPGGSVDAVDVLDQRLVTDGYSFARVEGTRLPYADASFDIVVSNHVIEHVGGPDDQLDHLREIRRVLAPGGICYLAVPNRWVLVEPHFKLPLLSWIPERLRSPYVRLARRGAGYDCDLPTRRRVHELVVAAGLRAEEQTIEAMRSMARIEQPGRALRLVLEAPDPLLRALLPVNPTMIFLLAAA